jgi:hypothetical protein
MVLTACATAAALPLPSPAGLLHDTVEDCGDVVGLEEIHFHFGPAVRRIVEGETKFRWAGAMWVGGKVGAVWRGAGQVQVGAGWVLPG